MTFRRRHTIPPNMLLSSISSWGDGVMAPPLLPIRHYAPSHVTEDTPPDLLEGTMDLEVTLPNGQTVIMSVHRSTPMMDLLIQVTTAHRINPGGHVIQVISDNIFLSYKPSTPIGTLDTNAIKIVAKNTLNEKAKSRKSSLQQQAIERNIRLKPKEWVYKQQLVVNLPRNQLAVYRVRPKALISEIFAMVCEDKHLDPETHEIRHPVNVDERLRGSCSISDYQLQEVCVVSSDFRPPPLSVTDLITMSSIAHPEDKKRRGIFGLFTRKAKSSTGDSSLSSGSAGERSVSPARSDESNEGRPISQPHSPTSSSATLTNSNNKVDPSATTAPSSQRNSLNSESSSQISRPVSMISLNKNRKRQAPVPPQRVKRTTEEKVAIEKQNISNEKPSLSRHSSDSSGYHELEFRFMSPSNSEVSSLEVSRASLPPTTNLASVSSSSVSSLKGGKRKAPSPPKPSIKNGEGPISIPESPEENENESLKDDESDCRSSTSSFVDKSSSLNVENHEEGRGPVDVIPPRETNGEDKEGNKESSSSSPEPKEQPIKEIEMVEEKVVIEDHDEFSSLDTNSLPMSNDSLKDSSHNESKYSEPPERSVAEVVTEAQKHSVDTHESPSHSFVTSEFISNKSSSQSHKAAQPKPCEITDENRALWAHSLTHPESKLTFSPRYQTGIELNTTQSMSASPKPSETKDQRDVHLMTSNFPDRLSQGDYSHSYQKSTFSTDSTYESSSVKRDSIDSSSVNRDSKLDTLPRTAKRKLLKIIPKFASLSRLQNKAKTSDKQVQNSYFSSTLNDTYTMDKTSASTDSKNIHSKYYNSTFDSNLETTKRKSLSNNLEVNVDVIDHPVKPAKYHIVLKSSSDLSPPNHQNFPLKDKSPITVESIFRSTSDVESTKCLPVPVPRSRSKVESTILFDPIEMTSFNIEDKVKTQLNTELVDISTRDISNNSKFLLANHMKENVSYKDSDITENLEAVKHTIIEGYESEDFNYDAKRMRKSNGVIIHIFEHGQKFDATTTPQPGKHHENGSSHLQDSLNSSLYSEAENQIQTQTVSLSSETSPASLEMINPKDIQRPKRHKRKKIPEEFMKSATLDETSSIGSNDISSLPSDISNPHNDASSSLHMHKNFERVHEVEENEREYEGNRSVDENLESFAQSPPKISEEFGDNETRFSERNTLERIFNSATTKTSKLAVLYVEDVIEDESTTDPVSPSSLRKQVFTSKVQLSTSEDELISLPSDTSVPDHRSISITQISPDENSHEKQDVYRNDVITELKSTIESTGDSPEDNPYIQPRILNLKPKDKIDLNYNKPSDYNLILNFRKKNDSPCDSPFNRSSSISSYESIDNNNFQKSRSSTETSYESVPPPPPDTRPPFPSDGESKTSSSVPSRQSSFNDNDSVEFVKPKVPVFSISTYQSRASKISYDKKLSRSESLASFKDLQGNEDAKSNDLKKLTRSDSQRNQIFTSDSIKKSTSTTVLNLGSSELNDKVATIPNVTPSLIKSQSRSSLHENGSGLNFTQMQNGTIQFDFSSSREPITFSRTLPNTYSNLRKAKSSFDVRSNEGRMPDGFQAIPDSGLANEYMRLQDDFMKWQEQLLQNQQLLHNRVAPIASNPPVYNSTGRIGGGLRLGWKTQVPWVVNNMMNQSSSDAPGQQQRKPVEINIPIRLVDSDEDTPKEQARENVKQNIQKLVTRANPPSSGPQWGGPSVSIDPWQERPSYVVKTQPVVVEPQISRQFDSQPRMQTIFQSSPQDAGLQSNNYQTPQMSFQQRPQPSFQHQDTRPAFQQPPQPSTEFQQIPQSALQRGLRNNVQPVQQNNYQQSRNQQQPQPTINYQQPQPTINYQQPQPTINYQQPADVNFQNYSEPNTQLVTKSYPQYSSKPQTISATPFMNDKSDDGISARFSSVVTLNNDKNSENTPQKDKVRSVVQLNNSDSPLGNQPSSMPFHSKIISGASKIGEGAEQERNSLFTPPTSTSPAPISSRLVQQAAQQPSSGGFRISPPKVERYSPSRVEHSTPQIERQSSPPQVERQFFPPQVERQFSPHIVERQPSPPKHEPSPPFGDVKLRHVETRVSPPKSEVPPPPAPLPPPPPSLNAPPPPPSLNAPPPPPPPPMSEADRRTATGKKIFGAANVPQLDAREELMMAIRQFGGSGNLRKSGLPPSQ